MILLVDSYDSFTFNLWQMLREVGAEAEVRRRGEVEVEAALAAGPAAVVLSPGPGEPSGAEPIVPLARAAAEAGVPVLGVCLGMQAISEAFGGRTARAPAPVHGKTSAVRHGGRGLFDALPSPLSVARYHSLVVDRAALPDCLETTAESDDGCAMALEHRSLPAWGVQFHPESIASEAGHELLGNFLSLAAAARAGVAERRGGR